MSSVAVIGSGFAGLSAACFAANAGHQVTIYEKNASIGGRARVFEADGFTFDMGPSWYWMPDVFDRFFANFGKKTSDYYRLVQLDPGFQIIYGANETLSIPKNVADLFPIFEAIEPGSADKLRKFLFEAAFKYEAGMGKLVYKPSFSWLEYADVDVFKSLSRLKMLSPVSTSVRKLFKDPRLVALLEFPVLFLGAMATHIPSLYTLMNYAALSLGTWYPMGGMFEIVKAMEHLALELGVEIKTNCEIQRIGVEHGKVSSLTAAGRQYPTQALIATGDYHHMEQKLLDSSYRTYSEEYWGKRTFAPSCLIFYIGVNKRISKLKHHNLFFDADIDVHSKDIYSDPKWPTDPLFYVCCPSKTDPAVAPDGCENLFILIPIATGLTDTEERREEYYEKVMSRLVGYVQDDFRPQIAYKRSYCVNDFVNDYHAYKGNAYGLANTLIQTAVLKPSLRNKKVKNLFYAGQLTVPGPGVPPSLVSGQLAADQINQYLKNA